MLGSNTSSGPLWPSATVCDASHNGRYALPWNSTNFSLSNPAWNDGYAWFDCYCTTPSCGVPCYTSTLNTNANPVTLYQCISPP